jgi:hypothetical protein
MSEYTFFGIKLIQINQMSVHYGITCKYYLFDFFILSFLGNAMAPSRHTVPIKISRSVSTSRTPGYTYPKGKSSMTVQSGRKLPPRPTGRVARQTPSGSVKNITLDANEGRCIPEPISQ